MPNKRPSPRRPVHSTFKYWTPIDYNVLKYQISNINFQISNIKYQISTFKYWTLIDYNVLKYQTANEIFWESINIILLVLKKTRNHSRLFKISQPTCNSTTQEIYLYIFRAFAIEPVQNRILKNLNNKNTNINFKEEKSFINSVGKAADSCATPLAFPPKPISC